MSSKSMKEQINDLAIAMKDKDELKCIDMLKELANMKEFNVNALYVKKPWHRNTSLLHESCEYGLQEVSKYLIEVLKADVNTQDIYGYTALHDASVHGHIDIVRYLINNMNIDVNIQDNYGFIVLHYPSGIGHIDIVRHLINNTNIVVNTQNKHGETALHVACDWKKREVVLELLKCNRIDVFIKNKKGLTAEEVARSKGYHDIAELITNYEPDFNVLDNK